MNEKKNWFSLKKKKDFFYLKKRGKKLYHQGFFIVYRENSLSVNRVGLVFSKKTGNAVQRSRFKKWARQFLKEKNSSSKVDLLLGFEKKPKKFYEKIKYKFFCKHFEKLFSQLLKNKK